MAKITSKYQVTVPKAIAEQYHIGPGDEIDWIPAGEIIRVVPPGQKALPEDRNSQLHLFDQATERHQRRARGRLHARSRGWSREDLYGRGRAH